MPSWLTKERTALLQKNKSKGNNITSNYRPIACFPLMWRLLSVVFADQIYGRLDQQKLLPEEQKGCRKRSRGTNELLYIARAVIREVKSRKNDLAMVWVDYKKVFVLALVPLSLILRKTKAAYEFSGSKENIIHLLFMDALKLYSRDEKGLESLVKTIRVFSEDIGMQFGIDNCAMLKIEKGKIVKSVGIELPNGKVINLLHEGEVISILEFYKQVDFWRRR